MIHFGDKFTMFLHRANINSKDEFVRRCREDGYAGAKTSAEQFTTWRGKPSIPVYTVPGTGRVYETICERLTKWTGMPPEQVIRLMTTDISLPRFVAELGIKFKDVRDGLSKATQQQWDELYGKVYPHLHFMATAQEYMNRRQDSDQRLKGLLANYYLYRLHSRREGVLREFVIVNETYGDLAGGVYYQWDPRTENRPRRIKFNVFFVGITCAVSLLK